LFDLVR